jgi:formylglycine-generating enzyme required for sulfatase activity
LQKICAAPASRTVTTKTAADQISAQVIKGGSNLCAPNSCRRDRPAARHAEAVGYVD